ncbi:MAG: hypothetical protein ACXVAY_17165 [Mucilaginibacter sp.]
MIKFNKMKMGAGIITFGALIFSQSAFAQQYKTPADTIKLNIAYSKVALEIAKLNGDLKTEQNKTSGYQSKSATTASDAASSAQGSKQTANIATNGNTKDAKIAMKQAKKANNEAKDAKNAKDDEVGNTNKIAAINEKIIKKQYELADLARQKSAILAHMGQNTPAKL